MTLLQAHNLIHAPETREKLGKPPLSTSDLKIAVPYSGALIGGSAGVGALIGHAIKKLR